MRHPGLVVVFAFYVSGGYYLYQVLVAFIVLGQEDEVIVSPVLVVLQPVVVMARDIDLAADDGLHRRVLRGKLEELLDTVHVAVVGDGQGRHAELFRTLEQLGDGGESVKDGVLGMDV